jgi:hypothetical protein
MNINRVNEEEIPYESLEEFGLTRNMLNDLPIDVISRILAGQRSPVLPVEVTGKEGQTIRSRARFSLVRLDDGKVDVMFHPVLKSIDDKICVVSKEPDTGKESIRFVDATQLFEREAVEKLKSGSVVVDYLKNENGSKVKSFLQLDPETNEVFSVPTQTIGRNIQILADEFSLTAAEINCLQNGEVLVLAQDNDMLSIGIDLDYPTGLRLEKGDEKLWRDRSKREWNKFSVGVFGCWKMEAGDLSYIDENDYSDEIWEEIERQRNYRKAFKL